LAEPSIPRTVTGLVGWGRGSWEVRGERGQGGSVAVVG